MRIALRVTHRAALAAAIVVFMTNAAMAQSDVDVLVDRAVAYVERFQENFGSVFRRAIT